MSALSDHRRMMENRSIQTRGEWITFAGRQVKACNKPQEKVPTEYLPEGERNAGNDDTIALIVSAVDFPSAPPEQAMVVRAGVIYTVLKATPRHADEDISAWLIYLYRTPAPDSATADPATGLRKEYFPPDQAE